MGIFTLRSYILNKYGDDDNIVRYVNFEGIKSLTLGFDILCVLHNIMKAYPTMKDGMDILLNDLYKNNIKAIFVFDGKKEKNPLKLHKLIKRRKESRLKDYHYEMIQIIAKYRKMEFNEENNEKLNHEFSTYLQFCIDWEEDSYPEEECIVSSEYKMNKNYFDIFDTIHLNDSQFDKIYNHIQTEAKYATPVDIEIAKECIQEYILKYKAKFEIHIAPGEADFYLAQLYKDNQIRACVTNDTDLLVHKVGICVFFNDCNFDKLMAINRNNLLIGIKNKHYIKNHINLEELFLNMCILLGTDYSPNLFIPNNHGFSQYKIINLLKYNSIDSIIKNKIEFEEEYNNISIILDSYKDIRKIYTQY